MKESLSAQKKNLSGLIVLVLFGVFAVCILAVLLSGTNIYDRLVERDENTFDDRTAAQFLTTKIHSARNSEAVSVTTVDGTDAIRITETYDEELFQTLLYCHDGWLYEMFTSMDDDFDPEAGERILPVDRIEGTIQNSLLHIRLDDKTGTQTLLVYLRGGEVQP